LYLRIGGITGVIYGNVRLLHAPKPSKTKKSSETVKEEKYDAVFFKGIPPRWLMVSYKDKIEMTGDLEMKPFFMHFAKRTPEELKKDSSLYFEFKEFRINENRRITAKIVVPYMMGLPTLPLKRFTVRRGAWSDRTLLAFRNINYSGVDGLSASFYLRLREKFLKGDHDIKLYERKLFGLEGPKRGVLFSGKSELLAKNKKLLEMSTLWNSGEESFNIRLSHRLDFKYLSYAFTQIVSGQKKRPTFVEFSSDLTIKKLKIIVPRFQFTHDWEKSYSYRLSTPLSLVKNLNLNFSWQRRIIRDNYRSDTSDFTTSLHFNASLFSVSSNYNFSKNLLEAAVRKNFSVNMRLKPLQFLMNNISMDISTFFMFSSLPYGDQTLSRTSPGINFAIRSAGALMPLGFNLIPTFTFNHLWDKQDNQEQGFTDFNYSISLQKEIGKFTGSVDYALASRYRVDNFWIEGSSRQNLNLNLQLKDLKNYSFLLRFYYNNNLDLENISFTGQWNLPYDLRFSSFLLFYNREKKFQTLEVFIEKTFKKRIKIQGGYSLALKRFFIKFLTL
ncbi:MAG: hypothetical protein JSV88_31775, partial [Candidatus Aminicenantes bacterium]